MGKKDHHGRAAKKEHGMKSLFERLDLVDSRYICANSNRFRAVIGWGAYGLGVQVEEWGVRLLLGWWHICLHLKEYEDG